MQTGSSVATLLLDAGMPPEQVQKFLRHKLIATTQMYAETSWINGLVSFDKDGGSV